jgi:hypothetical protein
MKSIIEESKAVLLGEAKSSNRGSQTSIDFENIGGGMNIIASSRIDYKTQELIGIQLSSLGMFSSSRDITYVKPVEGVSVNTDKKTWDEAHDIKDLSKEIKSLMDRFDSDILRVLKKYKFEKSR